jgi:hypothetical protein
MSKRAITSTEQPFVLADTDTTAGATKFVERFDLANGAVEFYGFNAGSAGVYELEGTIDGSNWSSIQATISADAVIALTHFWAGLRVYTTTAGTALQATILSSNAETYALTDGWTLLISIDGEANQTVTFNTGDFGNIALATADEVATVILADTTDVSAVDESGSVRISNTRGVGADFTINPTGGTAAATLGFSAGAVAGVGATSEPHPTVVLGAHELIY